MNKNKGFTLIEILMALGIGMVVLAAIYVAVNASQKTTSGIERKVIAQQDVRSALNIMSMEIRMASYNRLMADDSIWRNPANCVAASANPLYRGIQGAGPFSITVEMDVFDTGKTPPPAVPPNAFGQNSNEIITYTYEPANMRVTRNTNCGGAQAFLGETVASGNPRTVEVVNDVNANNAYDAGADIPVFRYFDGKNIELFPGTTPAVIPDIRTIEITLVVDTADIDLTIKQKRRMIYSTRVVPRNHFRNPYNIVGP